LNIKKNKLENARVELEIEVPVDLVEDEFKSVFKKIQKSAKVDGFRKGKAPVQLVEQKYEEHANSEVAETLIRKTISDALKQEDVIPIAEPMYEMDKISRGKPFTYKAFFDVLPTVELSEYKNLNVEEAVCNITEDDLSDEMETIREKFAVYNPKEDGVCENGDSVKFLIKRIDDVKPEEIETMDFKEYTVVLGQSKEDHTLDKDMLGMKVDEEKEIKVNYPKGYSIKELAGQKVLYKVKIKEINNMELPDLDDEFAKKNEYESLEDMKKNIEKDVTKYVENKISIDVQDELITKIVEASTFDIPLTMIEAEKNAIFHKTQERIGAQFESIEQFSDALGVNKDDFEKSLETEALKSIKSTIVLSEIAKKEELSVSEEKFKETLEAISKSYKKSVEEIEKILEENNTKSNVEQDILLEEARDFISKNAKIKKLKPITLKEFLKQNSAQ